MATAAQIKANRANAQKSTGPKTDAGRAKSSKNRLSHGFFSSALFIPGENPEDFHNLLADLHAEFQPATSSEQMLLEKMVQHHWLSLRAYRLQASALAGSLPAGEIHQDLGLLIRYHNSSDRAFLRFRTELVNSQKQRKNSEIGFDPQTALSEEENALSEEENDAPGARPEPETPPQAPPKTTPLAPPTPPLVSIEDQIEEFINSPLPMSDAEIMEYIRNWKKTTKAA